MWKRTSEELPPDQKVVITKIDDGNGVRNEQPMKLIGNLWYFDDGSMYVYYTPTHWRLETDEEWFARTASQLKAENERHRRRVSEITMR